MSKCNFPHVLSEVMNSKIYSAMPSKLLQNLANLVFEIADKEIKFHLIMKVLN